MNILEMIFGALCDVYYLVLSVAGGGSFPKKLTPQEEAQYIEQLAHGDSKARNILIEHNLRLVAHVTKKYMTATADSDDMVSIGTIGLIKSVQKFDCSFGVKFSTYAVPMIIGEIKRFIRDDGIIKVSRTIKETAIKAMAVKEQITNQNGFEPSIQEIADVLKISPQELSVALEAGLQPESLYSSTDDGNRENLPLIERLEDNSDLENTVINRLALRQLICELEPREQTILHLRYFKQKTQMQIAEKLGISQVQVSRIEKKLLLTMREKLINSS